MLRWPTKILVTSGLVLTAFAGTPGLARNEEKSDALTPTLRAVSQLVGDDTLKSVSGKEFNVYQFRQKSGGGGATSATHRFLVQGGLHGNELTTSEFVLWLARRYAQGISPLNKLENAEIDFLPHANPDGSHQHSRYNARGVNLNRNFDVMWGITRENPGEKSFSEPETRAIRSLFKARKYTAAVDVHGYINWLVAPSSPEDVRANGGRPSRKLMAMYAAWIADLRREMRLLPTYQLKTGAQLGDGGAFEDWAMWSEGTLAYCLELASFQRYESAYRRDFADITRDLTGPKLDTYPRYEMLIYRMFENAVRIHKDAATIVTER
jgi:succinylglutamate desuccinylase